jgi:hypothetical protein
MKQEYICLYTCISHTCFGYDILTRPTPGPLTETPSAALKLWRMNAVVEPARLTLLAATALNE